jgi:hypothetical protein
MKDKLKNIEDMIINLILERDMLIEERDALKLQLQDLKVDQESHTFLTNNKTQENTSNSIDLEVFDVPMQDETAITHHIIEHPDHTVVKQQLDLFVEEIDRCIDTINQKNA